MMNSDSPNGEMVVYVGDDGKPQIQARLQDENMWLTQVQLAQVFQTTRQNIGQHIKNIYEGARPFGNYKEILYSSN